MKSSNKCLNSQKSEIQHSNSLKGLIHIAKQRPKKSAVCIGEQESTKIGPKSVININFFLGHRSEILAMKEQVQMIRSFIHA